MATNSKLVKGAKFTSLDLDTTPDGIGDEGDTYNGTVGGADTYYLDNTRGGLSVGDKLFTQFAHNDSLLTSTRIFDGNNDGFIVLGANARLDVERSSKSNGGTAQFNMIDEDGQSIYAMRDLGHKAGTGIDAAFVYADAATLVNLINEHNDGVDGLLDQANGRQVNVVEGTVGNDTLVATAGVDFFFFDTALGLNLGRDTITGFGVGDRIVTTSAIWNQNADGEITYGSNNMLDLPGADGGAKSDPTMNPGGQIVFGSVAAPTPDALTILGTEVIDGTTYYHYGFPSL